MLIRLSGCAGCSASLLFSYGINRFCHDVAGKISALEMLAEALNVMEGCDLTMEAMMLILMEECTSRMIKDELLLAELLHTPQFYDVVQGLPNIWIHVALYSTEQVSSVCVYDISVMAVSFGKLLL